MYFESTTKEDKSNIEAGKTDKHGITPFDFEFILNAYAVAINLQSLLKETAKFIYTSDKTSLPIIIEKRQGYLSALDKLEVLETKEESREIIKQMREALAEGREANFKVFEAVQKGDLNTAMRLFTTIVDPTINKVQGLIPEFIKRARVHALVTELVDRASEINHFDFDKILIANGIIISLQSLLKETAKILYSRDLSCVPNVLGFRAKYQDALDNLQRLTTDREEKEIINELGAALTKGRQANNKLFNALSMGEIDEAMDLFTTIVDPTIDHVQKAVTELVKRALPLKDRATQPAKILGESIYSILDSLKEGIMVLDADSTIIHVNPVLSSFLGASKDRLLWKKLSDIEPGAQALNSLKTKKSIIGGYDSFKKIGKHIIFDTHCILKAGEVVGLVIICRDISDLIELDQILTQFEKSDDSSKLSKESLPEPFTRIVGSSVNFVKTLWFASQVAPTEAPVMLEGESGVGKELFAWAIHNTSSRTKNPMISVNCAAIPEPLFESELFGYEGGAFTGAKKSGKPGKFELASGGTLFLDEVGEMPLTMQSKLLRVLQEGKIEHLGGIKQIPVDARIIAATNRNLSELVDEKKFRQDLFYRLNVISIRIPPLRERIEDIPELANEFIRQHKSDVSLSTGVIHAFCKYPWPGNVRELKNVIYRAVILRQKGEILLEDLPTYFSGSADGAADNAAEKSAAESQPLTKFVADVEKEKILKTLDKCKGNRTKAIQSLGICRRTFYKKLKKYGIE